MDMSWRVLWLLFCSLLTAVRGLNNCLPSRAAYVNLSLGDAEDVPMNFTSGIGAQICIVTYHTCCPLPVEQSINDAAFANVREMMPAYSLYLNKSDDNLFSHYNFTTDVIIEAIRGYFELSVPANATSIRRTLNRITRQLDSIQRNNGGSSFQSRMRELFSYSYLERMRGLYNLSPNGDYNISFIDCALEIIEQDQISDEITSAMDVMEYQFRSLHFMRGLLYNIYIVFFYLEQNLPYINCVRSFAELFYCHICLPETTSLFPCRNVCKNVLSGCTIFLHVTGEEIVDPLRTLCQLNTMTNHPSWNLHNALEVINNNLYSIFDTSLRDLLQIASRISSCSEAPALAVTPTPTDNPNITIVGRAELLSNVSTSLTSSLHTILVTNLSSMFLDFENITQNVLESECGSFPESSESPDFECWHRTSSSTTDVDYLGINFQAVLFGNQDLTPPSATFINNFNASVDQMRSDTTRAMDFINTIPADMRVNLDNCNSSLSQLLLPPTFPPTVTITTATTTATPTATPTTESVDNGSTRTGFNTALILLSAIWLLILIH